MKPGKTETFNPDLGSDRALQRSREQARATRTDAEQARARVQEIDTGIDAAANRTREYRKALKKAENEVAQLKQALKSVEKQHEKLVKDRDRAGRTTQQAEAAAQKADERYSNSVLSEMVRREKLADLGRKPATGVKDPAKKARRESREVPAPERPGLGTATATATAARTTN